MALAVGAEAKSAAPLVRAVAGPMRSGKTAAVAARVRELLEAGVPAGELLLVAASVDGAANLKRRLCEACGAAAAPVRTMSVRALELAVLEAQAGRPVRLLLDVEQSLLLADLKAAGMAAAQLAGLLERAGQSWAAGEAPCDEAAQAVEEALERRGAQLPQEVAYRAWRALVDAPELRERWAVPYLLVDDANGLSPVAVRFLGCLATRELRLAGNPVWTNALFDPGAQADAFVKAADEVETLPEREARPPAQRMAVKWLGLEEEATGAVTATVHQVREQVRRQRERGIEDLGEEGELPPLCAAQVAVCVPAKAWAVSLERGLGALELPVSRFLARQPVGGDPRRRKTCAELEAFTVLGLLANPRDVAAWRTWVALGRADLASPAWLRLEAQAAARGLTVMEALASLKADDFAGAGELVESYACGCELIERYGKRVGFGLLKAVDPAGSPTLLELCEPLSGEEPVAEVFSHLCANLFDRHFSSNPACVRVGCPESFMGMEPISMLALGCNEGVVPAADQGREPERYASEFQGLLHVLGCGRESVVASYAQRCPVEAASKLGARYRRTRRDGSEELAVLAPSPVLAALGHDAPPTLSGQQYASVVLGVRP